MLGACGDHGLHVGAVTWVLLPAPASTLCRCGAPGNSMLSGSVCGQPAFNQGLYR